MHSDFELEAELKELMASLSGTDLESEAEWEAAGTPPCPGRTQRTVSHFPRYGEGIASLPPSEQQKLRQIAGIILSSRHTGCKPELQVDLVGHADRDFQRGPAFEHQISIRRALAVQRVLQQLIGKTVSSGIVWQARGVGARNLLVKSPRNEQERARNRRVEIILSPSVSASYPVLIKRPGVGYTWTVPGSVPAAPAAEAEYEQIAFPVSLPVLDSQQPPYKWICSLEVDFGPEVLPGPIVTGKRILARGSGTLISSRHVLTAGHVVLTQGPEKKDIFGTPVDSTLAALSVTVIPGRDGGKVPAVEPQGRLVATKTRVSPAWKQSNATNRAFDYGLITLAEPLPSNYGFWSTGPTRILPQPDSALKDKIARCSGYPASSCPPPDPALNVPCNAMTRGTVQFQMSGGVTDVTPELLETEMKIAGGHSGSPTWLLNQAGAMNLVGIASASKIQSPEIAVRIRSALLEKIRAWMIEDGIRPTF